MDLNTFRTEVMNEVREKKNAYAKYHGVDVDSLIKVPISGSEMSLATGIEAIEKGGTTAKDPEAVNIDRSECVIRVTFCDLNQWRKLSEIDRGWYRRLLRTLRSHFQYYRFAAKPNRMGYRILCLSNIKSNLLIDTEL